MNGAGDTPGTLRSELLLRGRLPVDECVRLGLALTTALGHLHRHGLVHRDIKPSNIVFVNGIPKLADIGLVAQAERTMSFVGTEGYLPPEGPGTVPADLFSLGKVLYEIATGHDRQQFPELPTDVGALPDRAALAELNEVLVRACAPDVRQRYQTAAEMHADLAVLQSGGSVARQRRLAGRLRFVQRAGVLVTVLAVVIAAGWAWQARQTARMKALAEENLALARAAETSAARAADNEAVARASLYAADIQLAQQALRSDNLCLARALLQNHVPRPGEPDLRGFEWRYLWRQSQGEELFRLPGNQHTSLVIEASPDARRLAVGGYDRGTIRVFDPALRGEPIVLPDTNRILSLAFPAGTNQLISASPMDVRIWDLSTHLEVRRLPGAAAPAVLSPNGRYLLTGAGPWEDEPWARPQELLVWDTATWNRLGSVNLPVSTIRSIARHLYLQVAFGSDSSQVAVLAGDRIRMLICPGLQEIRQLPDSLPPSTTARPFLAFSPDNRTLAFPGARGFEIRLWDLEANHEVRVLRGHSDHVFAARFSPDGSLLATGSPDQTTRLWRVDTGGLLRTLAGQADEVIDVAFSPEGGTLFTLGVSEGEVLAWNPGHETGRSVLRRQFRPLGFNPDATLEGVLTDVAERIRIDPATLESELVGGPVPGPAASQFIGLNSLSANGRYGAIRAPGDNRMEIWDRVRDERLCVVPAETGAVSFDPDRDLVTTRHRDAEGFPVLSVWQLPDGRPRWLIPDPVRIASGLLPSAAGLHVLVGLRDSLAVYQLEAAGPVLRHRLPADHFVRGALSPDGRWIASGAADIRIYRLDTGAVTGWLRGHTRKNTRPVFSPDSRTLATTCDDRTLRLWHLATHRELLRFDSPEEDLGAFTLEFSPDGRALACFRVDAEGPATTLLFAPSFAEIAVVEGGDYRALAGDDAGLWLAVAGELYRRGRPDEALAACDRALELAGERPEVAWLPSRAQHLRQRLVQGIAGP
ncbi:MAG: hypothetical protein KF791_01340 [Verrucomicrobiae bacterium]|nr:hypothetical protein [Verrucomicrobiae bacterium]